MSLIHSRNPSRAATRSGARNYHLFTRTALRSGYARQKIILYCCCWILTASSTAHAQLAEIRHQFIPTDNCLKCHEVPGVRDAASGLTDRVRMSEWKIWAEQDKHASAYKVLSESRSQRIGQLLGKDVLAPATGCIQCHTSNAVNELWSPACFRNGQNAFVEEGVSCQTCHGPAELWESEHIKPGWRAKTPAEKAEFGFNTMEDPVQRATMCTSCHIGRSERGRIITHEMYAAGHPMLSGFDMEAFADKMPRHWRYSHEKPGGKPFNFERTRAVLIGSVVAMKTAVQLADSGRGTWPELARLECYSCHHELQTPSWRQADFASRPAGQPRLELGCLPLVKVAAEQAGGAQGTSDVDQLIAEARAAFSRNIFGDVESLGLLRSNVDEWSVQIEPKLMAMPLDQAKVRQILDELLQTASSENHDFDTARQLTGATVVIAEELSRSGAQVKGLPNLLTRLKALEDDERGFALVSTTDKRVEDKFGLQLANRARFKPQAYAALMKSLREGMR
jgi:hypothetical protein